MSKQRISTRNMAVIAMFSAVLFFHETIPLHRWLGCLLIMAGCVLIVR